ncbi:hypothetical protein F4811DRAFT_114392 [Daldinia bambusicola]|nr:hypothetical protein F4811DRAFT_114392 [Daldinia bambusicola]
MASGENTGNQGDDNDQGKMEWKLGNHRQYSPPAGIPEYVKKALPPRPGSRSSSIYSSPDEGAQQPLVQNPKLQDIGTKGALNEAGLTVVQPLQPTTSSSHRSEIAAPQPRYPARMILETSEADDMVISPISNPLSANTNIQQYEVSPISPNESTCSLHSAISSTASPDPSSSAEEIYLTRRPFVYEKQPMVYPSADLLLTPEIVAPNQKHQFQYQQINLRYSDPGSPLNGAVIHPPTSFPSDPNLRLSRHLDGDEQSHTPASRSIKLQLQPQPQPDVEENNPENASSSLSLTPTGAVVSSPKVAFAGTVDGFSTRPRANSKRTAPAPPPLKLSERPLAEHYVKTPFPGVEAVQRQDTITTATSTAATVATTATIANTTAKNNNDHRSNSTRRQEQQRSNVAAAEQENKHKDREEERNRIARKRNRVSSLPGLVLAKTLRQGGGEKDKDKEKEKEKEKSGPKVKSILSRAKSLRKVGRGLGLGIGIGAGSEEARKERRREEMKRQIRIGEPLRE